MLDRETEWSDRATMWLWGCWMNHEWKLIEGIPTSDRYSGRDRYCSEGKKEVRGGR